MLLKLRTLEDPDLNHMAPMWRLGRVQETGVQGGVSTESRNVGSLRSVAERSWLSAKGSLHVCMCEHTCKGMFIAPSVQIRGQTRLCVCLPEYLRVSDFCLAVQGCACLPLKSLAFDSTCECACVCVHMHMHACTSSGGRLYC